MTNSTTHPPAQSDQSALALLGSLLLEPSLYATVAAAGIIPAMFPADVLPAATAIWKIAATGQGWDVNMIADKAGWTREEKRRILSLANPELVEEHAQHVREAHLSRLDAQILTETALKLEAQADYWETTAEMDYRREQLQLDVQPWKDRKGDMIREALEGIARARASKGLSGITTGWTDTDRFLGGWQPGDLVILAARPGMGKTTVMMHHARAAALAGHRPAIFTLEMTGVQLIQKWIAEAVGITTGALRNGAISTAQWDAIQAQAAELYNLPIYFEDFQDSAAVTAALVRDRARLMHERNDVDIFFVDYLQLMSGRDRRESRNYQIEDISRTMKAIAKNFKIPVIVLSQLNRSVEIRGGTKRPGISDLRDSGSLEQDADIIILLYRPEYYQILEDENGDSLKGQLEYIVAKDRVGGLRKTFTRHWSQARYHAEPVDEAPASTGMTPADTSQDIPF